VLDTPRVTRTTARQTAVIHLTIPREEIRKVMGPSLAELRAAVAAQGVAVDGPWFTHHLRMAPETFDFEIGLPVRTSVAAAGRVRAAWLPAATVARTVHHGPYEGLPAAWSEFGAWIAANGYTPGPDLWECYVVGPESNPDPTAWHTELTRPLVC
jgi:effector-binding domain-containing protein